MSNVAKFEPTPEQAKLLSVFQDADYEITIRAACNAAGVSHMAYYRWMDHEDFRQWWKGEAERFMTLGLVDVMANLKTGATRKFVGGKEPDAKPDAGLIRLYLERFDREYVPRTRQEQTGANGGPIEVREHVGEEELLRRAHAARPDDAFLGGQGQPAPAPHGKGA